MDETRVNKDLILREKLAIERTVMANQRTFLSFLRTSLYFSIAGFSIKELLVFEFEPIVVTLFFTASFVLLIAGIITYLSQRKKIVISRKQVGGRVDIDD